jgi:hypothetical protein
MLCGRTINQANQDVGIQEIRELQS